MKSKQVDLLKMSLAEDYSKFISINFIIFPNQFILFLIFNFQKSVKFIYNQVYKQYSFLKFRHHKNI